MSTFTEHLWNALKETGNVKLTEMVTTVWLPYVQFNLVICKSSLSAEHNLCYLRGHHLLKFTSPAVKPSLLAQRVKRLPAIQEIWVRSLGREDLLEKEMAPHSSVLAWRIPWMEEPGMLQSTGSQSQTRLNDFTFTLLAVMYKPIKTKAEMWTLISHPWFNDFP